MFHTLRSINICLQKCLMVDSGFPFKNVETLVLKIVLSERSRGIKLIKNIEIFERRKALFLTVIFLHQWIFYHMKKTHLFFEWFNQSCAQIMGFWINSYLTVVFLKRGLFWYYIISNVISVHPKHIAVGIE